MDSVGSSDSFIKMDIINQETTYTLGLDFTDDQGGAVTPTSASYRIDDLESGNEVVPWTSIFPTTSSFDLVVTAEQNAMAGNSTDRETRVVTVKFGYSADSKQDTDEYRYWISRLPYLLAGNNASP
jgi:hypothetical protein